MKKIKKIYNKYNKIIIIFSLILIVVFLLGETYAMFQKIDEAEYANSYKTGNLQIEFDDTSDGLGGVINLNNTVPISDLEGEAKTPYKFKIKNTGNLSYQFDLKLVVDSTYVSSHGCSDKQVNSQYIKIKINEQEITLLSELTDNILLENITIAPYESITYELRAWLKEGTPNNEIGKHYHGKLAIDGFAIYTDPETQVVYNEPNAPELVEGLIPVTYNDSTNNWVVANSNNSNNSWYDYENQKWANAVMVKDTIDSTSSIAYDSSGNQLNGTINGATLTSEGLSFDGVNDYMVINNVNYNSSKAMTIDFYAKVEETDLAILFESSTNSNSYLGSFYVDTFEYGTNDITLAMKYGSTINHKMANNALNTSEFKHYTIVFDSTKTHDTYTSIYIDGVLQTVTTVGSASGNINNNTLSNYPLYVASRAGTNYFAKMILKNLRLYNKALTSDEINSNIEGNITTSNLLFNYDFVTTKREKYQNADVGTTVSEDDILGYYTWIPRYKYKLFNADYESGTTVQLIDIAFENETNTTGTVTCTYADDGTETCTNKANGNWYTHPAFTLGDEELKGIWFGKFETTGSSSSPTIKPNSSSLRNITVSQMYTTAQLFNTATYFDTEAISTIDSHMMKNIEWGAVAYLKQSKYGLGITDIGVNSNSSYYTGGNDYKTNVAQSTTGNITGIYDMAGGAYEYVMGNYGKNAGSSGLTISNVASKYIDIYAGDNVSYSHLGDALGETASWYSDYTYFTDSTTPWFTRGGNYNHGTNAGVFVFYVYYGYADSSGGFRVVLTTN